ncbi:MAG TPA: hypothetical protein DCL63_00350 [Firmicutes bacterium]|nr:hypothetical protein [Bacillota bacterium]HBK60321.1 hypothetical protein [Bacillota bacterium]
MGGASPLANSRGARRPEQLKRGAFAAIVFSVLGLLTLVKISGGLDAWRDLAHIDPIMLGIAFGLIVLTWLFDSLRMRALVHSLGGSLSILEGMRISVMGAFVCNVTPFDTGGEPVQAYLLIDKGLTAGQSTAVVAVKAIMNAFARVSLGFAASAALLFSRSQWSLPLGMDIALSVGTTLYIIVFLFSLYLVFKPEKISVLVVPAVRNRFTMRFFKPETLDTALERIDHELREFREALQEFISNRRPALAAVLLLSYAAWIATMLIPAVVLTGLGLKTPYVQAMGVTIIFYLASAYAPTPGSSGAAELGFAALFSSIVPRAVLGLFVAVWRMITYYLNLALGGVLMALGFMRRGSGPPDRITRADNSDAM